MPTLTWVYTEEGGPKSDHNYHSLYTDGYYAYDELANPYTEVDENGNQIGPEFTDIYYPHGAGYHIKNYDDAFDLTSFDGWYFKVIEGHVVGGDPDENGWGSLIHLEETVLVPFSELPPQMQYRVRVHKRRLEARSNEKTKT